MTDDHRHCFFDIAEDHGSPGVGTRRIDLNGKRTAVRDGAAGHNPSAAPAGLMKKKDGE
jgi:hypothetical protein